MPPSNKIIITNETTVSKTPLLLHLRRENPCKKMFDLCVSEQKILFKRNSIETVKFLIIKIINPIFIGCDKINLDDSLLFGKINIDCDFKLNIINCDGNIVATFTIPVGPCLFPEQSETVYCLRIPLGDIDISKFNECTLQLEICGFKLNKCSLHICNKLPKCVQICGTVQLC